MKQQTCILIGAPMDCGKRRQGCLMGPDSYRTAGLVQVLGELGHNVRDLGNVTPATAQVEPDASVCAQNKPDAGVHETCAYMESGVYAAPDVVAWTRALHAQARAAMVQGIPIFMGGDHAIALGTLSGVAAHAQQMGRPQFVLWLDAHSDFHTPHSTASGNLHGTPLAYVSGRAGFEGFPAPVAPVPTRNICLFGIRSVDTPEAEALARTDITITDMRAIDQEGITAPLTAFLQRVTAAGGMLHVSLDVDFLDPVIAPAVGTTVPGGATLREAHLVMELLHDSGLVTSLDLVELNPFLDERGRTARVMVDLTASLFGRRVFDRPTRGF